MSMAVASTRFAAVVARAESALSRSSAALSMAAPVAGSSSMSCVFSEFGKGFRSGMNVAIVARAAEIFDLATEEAAAAEAEAPAAAPVQQGTKLYVGNLPWTCDSAQLAEICQDIGVVEAVEVIYDQESGRSRGFAFVTMASEADAQAVINALDGNDMGGRPLRVNYPQPRGDRPRFERSERSERGAFGGERRREDNPNKLFVGNLTWGCDDGALHQLFSDYGRVVDAKVVYDRETGRSRGFGFVTLENASEVNSAIKKLDGADFDGRQLRVNLAGDKPPPRREF
jgi:nucleolin